MPVQIVKLLDPIQMSINGTFNPMGAYNAGTDYAVGDQVDYNGSSYIMYNNAAAGTVPTNTSYWGLVASKGDTGATGAAGADGADGATGPQGPAGADGLTVSVNSVTQVAGDISLTQDNIPDGTTNKAYTATEQSKLSGIEALADVTDATNVAAAGAVMDGDFSGNGVMTRTAAGTYTSRTLTGTTNQITVTNGDGVSGNPTLSLPQNIHTGASPTFSTITATGSSKVNVSSGNPESVLQVAGVTKYKVFYDSSNNLVGFQTPSTFNFGGSVLPQSDSAYTNGTSSLYWSNTYTDRLYLNSTFNIDGAVAGTGNITGNLGILATSGSATHSLTLGSTSTGIALYNTVDQTTNFERVRMAYISNEFRIGGTYGGSGNIRPINISAFDSTTAGLRLNASSTSGVVQSTLTTGSAGSITSLINGTLSSSSGIQYPQVITPTINQSSTGGYTALLINPTETATGSGTKLLIDAQVGGSSKFKVDNTGRTTIAEALYVGSGGSTSAMQMNYRSANIYSAGLAIVKRGTTGDDTAALTNNTEVGYHSFQGWTGTANKRLAYVIVKAKGAIGDSSGGGTYSINTRGDAGNTEAIRLVIDENGLTITDAHNIVVGTTTGTKIGTATNQKLGFYNATPVVQPSSTPANATDLATALTLVNDLKSKLITLGLIA